MTTHELIPYKPRLRPVRPRTTFVPYQPIHADATLIPIPDVFADMYNLRLEAMRRHPKSGRRYMFDGRLIGDIGEELAEDYFGMVPATRTLLSGTISNRATGLDGLAPDGRSLQVKTTQSSKAGPAFSQGDSPVDHLLFFYLNFEDGIAEVVYNGPEAPVRACLPAGRGHGRRSVTLSQVLQIASTLDSKQALKRIRF